MGNILILVAVVLALVGGYTYYGKTEVSDVTNANLETQVTPAEGTVKEFSMTSWMETTDGKMSAHFSLNEIRVKKGDTVKITITNTAGTHDFVLDEFNVAKETPLNEPVVVEFVADKTGTFEYYCSKYNHRQIGQKGNLIVE
ncbi:hypothetical protein EXS57_00645 [Candidatus Kaiserbacteria bacterium]|nr:hypothetical protein [Candidatus Kaiserbacteria bacterium]